MLSPSRVSSVGVDPRVDSYHCAACRKSWPPVASSMSLASPTPRNLWRACCDKRDLFSCCGSHLRPGVAKSKTGELLLLLQGQPNSHSGYPGYTIEQESLPANVATLLH